jgi:hypothetical protein
LLFGIFMDVVFRLAELAHCPKLHAIALSESRKPLAIFRRRIGVTVGGIGRAERLGVFLYASPF